MATKNYSLLPETINTVSKLAKATIRSQGSIIDIAVAELAKNSIDENGAIDLPASSIANLLKHTNTSTSSTYLEKIQGVRRGVTA